MDYKKGDVCSFLLKYQVTKGSDFTHTSIVKPTGAFYIPPEKIDDFYALYKKGVQCNEDLYVTEKHRDISPILIDLDFRFAKTTKIERQFTNDHIDKIITIYSKAINKFIAVDNFDMFAMTKPGPVIDKELIKDGLHIVVPSIVTKPEIQHLIRRDVLKEIESVLSDLNLINSIQDVIDEAVIEKNNWQMYGSKKPNCESYKVIKAVKVIENNIESLGIIEDKDYVELFSIRNKYKASQIKDDALPIIEEYKKEIEKKKKPPRINNILQNTQNNQKNTYHNLDYIKKLVNILNVDRTNKYDDWIRVGWCLRTIDHRLLDTWIDFSKKSKKFMEGECEKMWNYMKENGLGVGTLHMWAKQDDPEQFKIIQKQDLASLILTSKNETHHDVAKVVHHMFKYEYVCVAIKQNLWYEFKNHRWVSCDSGHTLSFRISTDVCSEYLSQAAYWNQKAADDQNEQERYAEIGKKFNSIALKLRNINYKNNILNECKTLFYIQRFEELLDSKSHLIGFNNGIYDLENLEFREGRPEDYISFTTGINYVPYIPDDEIALQIDDFLSKVLTKSHMKEYVLLLLSSFLNGNIKEERFHIWTGSGCFAKGTPIMMFDGTSKNVEDIKEKDVLMGDDSTPRNVQELFRGYSDMYRIIPIKGESFVVNGEHDLVVKAGNYFRINKREYNQYRASWIKYVDDDRVIVNISKSVNSKKEAEEILEEAKNDLKSVKNDDIIKMTVHQYLKLPKNITDLLSIYRPEFVEFDKKEVSIDPYLVGYWLGDGSQYDIPIEYKVNDKKTRLELLAGIVDSDGHYDDKSKEIEITLKNEKLLDDVIWLARSLGMSCYKSKKGSSYFRTILIGESLCEIPTKIPGKKPLEKTCLRDLLKLKFKVERIEDDNFYGFELDGNRRFLLSNFIVTKNSNGKSKAIDLFEQSFGEYCCKLPITLLTQKRAASNAATSELARTKGKRFACLQEPSEDEKLNVGLMKELTGGDKIQARLLYKEPIEFKPQFKMILTCNNLPNVPSDDGGTWRRIRVVEFTSKFCENPEKENEFLADFTLSENFPFWRESFMALLIEYYKKYLEIGIIEPDEVLECTKEYQKNNDTFLEFIEQECERCDVEFISYNDIFNSFRLWCKDNNIQMLISKKKDFIKSIAKVLGKICIINKVEGWKGWRFKGEDTNYNDELDS